jgi:hypothetical protein
MRDAFSARDTPETAASEPGPFLPRMLGAYELIEEIGRGGMGVVYRARQKALDRFVAVKLLLGGSFSSEAALRRFQTEAAAVADLHHPGIVGVYDFGEHDGQPYLVMELIEGRNLTAVCDGRPMEARRAARLLCGLAEAVAHAHAHRILHRDLKPSNVLVDEAGHARVTDFGLARRMGEAGGATLTGQMLGSPSYASPEQASGGVDGTGPAVDIYGLGALFYHLLTGRPPFNAATPTETLRLVLEAEPPAPTVLNPALPRDLETICLKCLAKDPARRYETAAALADDVQRFLEHRPILARRPSMGYRICKFTRRHRVGVAATAGVVFALGLGAAIAVHGLLRAEREKLAAEEAMDQMTAAQTQLQLDVLHDVDRVVDASPLIAKAASVVRYFESLPPHSRTRAVELKHAEALELLANVLWASPQHDVSRATQAAREQLALREKIARESPDDDDAAAELIRAEGGMRVAANNHQFPFPLEHNVDMVRRFEVLSDRFPDSAKVKRCLATCLSYYAFAAVKGNLPDEAMAAARRARALREELVAAGYSDRHLPFIETDSLRAEAHAHAAKRDSLAAAETYTLLYERLAEKLRSDPADDTLRYEAARAALWGSHQIMNADSHDVACEVQLVAREHIRILIDRYPTRQDYRKIYVIAHRMEADHLTYGDGRFDRARAAWLHIDGLTKLLQGHSGGMDAVNTLALLAARSGDTVSARAWLDEGQKRFDAWLLEMPDDPEIRRLNRMRFEEWRWLAFVGIQAWSEALEQANQLLAEADDGLARKPELPELVVRRVMADVQAGIALAGLGRSPEAVVRMRDAVDRLAGMPFVYPVYKADHVFIEGTLSLCHALSDTGQLGDARRRAWALLGKQGYTADSHWVANELRARVWVLLARVLDPAEAPLRLACCERAWTILTAPESAGRITRDGREALEAARRIADEARAAYDALPIEQLAARLDAAAATDPALVDALLAADERAWGPDSAQSASFSAYARDAQRAMRLRCAELVARHPDSVGARFLHARTYRMEAFQALSLGARVDATRAALLDYDARLEKFASLPGYEGVGRIRALNAMHLAQLAASTGDARLASSEIAEARTREENWLASGALTGHEAHRWRARWLQEEALCAWSLQDRAELERVARASLDEVDAGLAEGIEYPDLRVRRAVGKAFSVLALPPDGLITTDHATLQDCRRELVSVAASDADFAVQSLVWALEDAVIAQFRAAGKTEPARAEAERVLRKVSDLRPFETERWCVDLQRAKAQVHLAAFLDPSVAMEELRRSELLDQACLLLATREAEGRMTRDGYKTRTKLIHLRGSICPENRTHGVGYHLALATP